MKTPDSFKAMTIFSRNLKLHNARFPEKKIMIDPKTRDLIYISMLQLAKKVRQEENVTILKQGFGLVPKLFFTKISLWIKRFVRNQYCKLAQLRSDTENYKVYVVQGRGLTFKLISTLDFKFNKSIRVFKKDLTAKEMEAVSCFIAYPKKK
jgi:hypothetical protein